MYLIEVTPYDQDTLSTTTLYFSDVGYTSGTAAVDLTGAGAAYTIPANTTYLARMKDGFHVQREMYQGNKIGGSSIPSFGDVKLENSDGALDYLRRYTWDGRRIRVVFATSDLSSATLIFDGTLRDALLNESELVLRLLDDQATLNEKLAEVHHPFDRAWRFVGGSVNNTIDCPAAASLMNFYSWTLEFWALPDYAQSNGVAVMFGDTAAASSTDKFEFWPSRQAQQGSIYANYDGAAMTDNLARNYADGDPHHYAIVYNAGTDKIKFYVDGELVDTDSTSGGPTNAGTQKLVLGSTIRGGTRTLTYGGLLWDVRGWTAERTADEIKRDMFATLDGTEDNLHFWYPLQDYPPLTNVKTVFDYGPNGYHGTVFGSSVQPQVVAYGGPQVEGKQRPFAMGRVFNAQPEFLSPQQQLYMISDVPVGGLVVYEGGQMMRGCPALDFDGSTNYVTISDDASYNVTGSGVTVELMINADDVSSAQTLLYWGGGATQSFELSINASGLPVLAVTDSSSNSATVTGTTALDVLRNYRLTCVVNVTGGYIALWINGRLEGTANGIAAHVNPTAQNILVGYNGSAQFFNGRVWDLRWWAGDVTRTQLWRDYIYAEAFPISYQLVAHFPGDDDNSGSTWVDFAPLGNDATITGTATWSAEEYRDLYDGRIELSGAPSHPITAGWLSSCPVGMGTKSEGTFYAYWADDDSYDPETGDWTIEFWLNVPGTPAANSFPVSKKGEASGSTTLGAWHVRADTGDQLRIYLSDGTTSSNAEWSGFGTGVYGEWHHYAAVWDRSAETMTLYMDGELDNSADLSALDNTQDFNSAYDLVLFANTTAGGNRFAGSLSEVRIWQNGRTAKQVRDSMWKTGAQLYSEGDGAAMTFYWRGDEDVTTARYGEDAETYNRGVGVASGTSAGALATEASEFYARVVPGPYPSTAGEHVRALVARAGVSITDEVVTSTLDQFDTDENSAEVGWFFNDGDTRMALDKLVAPVGYWVYDNDGLSLGRLLAPDVRNSLRFRNNALTDATQIEVTDGSHVFATDSGAVYAECWFQVLNMVDAQTLVFKNHSDGWRIQVQLDDLYATHWDSTSGNVKHRYATGLEPGTVYHVGALFYNSDSYPELWLDGVKATSTSGGIDTQPDDNLFIGNNDNNGGSYRGLNGRIHEVRVWRYAEAFGSSNDAIETHISRYASYELSGSETGLLGYWRIDEGTGTTITDSGPNGLDGTLSGSDYAWRPYGFYDDPVYREVTVTYKNSDEVEIKRLGTILPVTEQQVRYGKNFFQVPRDQTILNTYWDTELVRLLDGEGPTKIQRSRPALTRHLLPNKTPEIVEAPYALKFPAILASRVRIANFGVQRERYQVKVWDPSFSLSMGDEVRLQDTRFNFPTEGRNFVVIGIREEPDNNLYTLDLWG